MQEQNNFKEENSNYIDEKMVKKLDCRTKEGKKSKKCKKSGGYDKAKRGLKKLKKYRP